jgi:hypothetical protein
LNDGETYLFTLKAIDTSANVSTGATIVATPSSSIRLVDSVGYVGQYCSLAVDGNNVYICYFDETNGNLKIWKSTDGGDTWPEADIATVASAGTVGEYSALTVDDGAIFMCYNYFNTHDLLFLKSIDGGETWSDSKIVDPINWQSYETAIAVAGDTVYISYYEPAAKDLMFTRSTDGGETWPVGNMVTIESAGEVGKFNSIAVDGNNIYISYYQATTYDLKFTKSADEGVSWPVGNIVTVDPTGDVGAYNSISTYNGTVFISYDDNTNDSVKLAKSTDGGETWLLGVVAELNLSSLGNHSSIQTKNGTDIYISFHGGVEQYRFYDLLIARSTDGGVTWPMSNIVTVDSEGVVGKHNSLSVVGDNIYISYYNSTNEDLKFAKSITGGTLW